MLIALASSGPLNGYSLIRKIAGSAKLTSNSHQEATANHFGGSSAGTDKILLNLCQTDRKHRCSRHRPPDRRRFLGKYPACITGLHRAQLMPHHGGGRLSLTGCKKPNVEDMKCTAPSTVVSGYGDCCRQRLYPAALALLTGRVKMRMRSGDIAVCREDKDRRSSSADEKRLVVLISGGGGNLQALIDMPTNSKALNAEICAVFSNKAGRLRVTPAQQAEYSRTGTQSAEFSSRRMILMPHCRHRLMKLSTGFALSSPDICGF